MHNPNDNPIYREWKKRYNEQPMEIREKIDALYNMNANEYQLKVIRRTRPKQLNKGDVFVLSPRENIYFYGKVLKVNINHTDKSSFLHGKNVVFIFQCKTSKPTIEDYRPDYRKLLISPAIVDINYWTRGLFFNVGNEEIHNDEKALDYGFLKLGINSYWFCKEDGTKLNEEPKILGISGIATITGIAREIEKELIINPKLLEQA